MPSDAPNPNNTTPSIVEKVLVDIDPMGGVDESTSELAVDWTKRWLQAENFVVDGSVMRPRPGLTALPQGSLDGPVFRLAPLDDGLGVVSEIDYQLLHHNEASGSTGSITGPVEKGQLPEWAVKTIKFGSDQGSTLFTSIAGVLGVANLTNYDVVAYIGQAGSSQYTGVIIECMDKSSNNIVMRWTWRPPTGSSKLLVMVGVDGRYLHFYCPGFDGGEGGGSPTGPYVFVIDTQSPPASGDISSIATTVLTVSGTGWEIGAVTPISGGSIVVVNGHTSSIHDSRVHMEQFNNTSTAPTSVRNTDITNFFYVTGMDVDTAGNVYLAGYRKPPFDPTGMLLTGWWRAPYSGAPLAANASLGSSGTNGALVNGGTAPSVGTALNGFATMDFVPASTHSLATGTAITTFLSASSFSIAVLFNADTAAADNGASAALNSQIFSDRDVSATATSVGVSFSTSGVVAWVRDAVSASKTRSIAACGTGGWHLAKVTWDGTTKTLKCSIDANVLPAGSVSVNALTLSSALGGAGATGQDTVNFDGRIAEIMTSNVVFSNTDFDNIRDYINNRYSLSL